MQLSIAISFAALWASALAQKVKFMPLGDSITEITCWRAYVWDQFGAADLTSEVDFVGSVNNNVEGCTTTYPNFDTDHEGHSGYLSIDIANNYLQGWLASAQPDVVNFHLGTNDITAGHSTDEIIASYNTIVQLIRASNPNMQIIVEKLIPLSYALDAVADLNAQIPGWAEGLSTDESPIAVADCSTDAGFTTSMLRDGIHPNDQGDQLMASKIGPLVIDAVQEVLAAQT